MLIGEVAEWLKAAVSKTAIRFVLDRGFESHPLRHEKNRVYRDGKLKDLEQGLIRYISAASRPKVIEIAAHTAPTKPKYFMVKTSRAITLISSMAVAMVTGLVFSFFMIIAR